MPSYTIESEIFDRFPDFVRVVVIARGIDNSGFSSLNDLLNETAESSAEVGHEAALRSWDEAYAALGVDPKHYAPSVRYLIDRARRGRAPKSISTLVDIVNTISMKWAVPCGGDDLDSIGNEDVYLGLSQGGESFIPLSRPGVLEHPNRGEVIYAARPSGRVMCRRWTWRNGEWSKLTQLTTSAMINIDVMRPPFPRDAPTAMADDLGALIQRFCGGESRAYTLSVDAPRFDFATGREYEALPSHE